MFHFGMSYIGSNQLMDIAIIPLIATGIVVGIHPFLYPDFSQKSDYYLGAAYFLISGMIHAFNFRMEITVQMALIFLIVALIWYTFESFLLRRKLRNEENQD